MTNISPHNLSDQDLLVATGRAAGGERRATVSLLALLAELDSRRLYLSEGFSSLFAYVTRQLHFSEPEAYSRITAARTARRFPLILALLSEGALSLTTVGLIATHLTDDNHEAILGAARSKSKREVEQLVATLYPEPDIASNVRALPIQRSERVTSPATGEDAQDRSLILTATNDLTGPDETAASPPARSISPQPASIIAPLAPRRFLIKMTVDEATQQKLLRARDLLRHVVPNGDLATILDRALTALLNQTERTKTAALARPRTSQRSARRIATGSRRIPAAVRRTVWARDDARCAFVGSAGRCSETGALEFHHVVPFAAGGPATVDNIQLRCRAHNLFEAELRFGNWRERIRRGSCSDSTPSGRS